MGNHLSDPKLANVSDILTQEPFKSEWLDEQRWFSFGRFDYNGA